MVKIEMKSSQKSGPKVCLRNDITVFNEDGNEIHGIRSIDIRARLDEIVSAELELFVNAVYIDSAMPKYMATNPATGEYKEVSGIEFKDGEVWEAK